MIAFILSLAVVCVYVQWDAAKDKISSLERERQTSYLNTEQCPVSDVPEQCDIIDKELAARLQEAESNIEITEAYTKGTQQWEALMDAYLEKFAIWCSEPHEIAEIAEYKNSIYEEVMISQSQWEEYCGNAIAQQLEVYTAIYESGTAVPMAQAKYEYTLYRSRALGLAALAKMAGLSIE